MDIERALVMKGGKAFRNKVLKAMDVPAVEEVIPPEKMEAVADYLEKGKSMTKAELIEVIEKLIK